MGKGSQKSSTTVKVPAYLESQLKYGLSEARNLYDRGAPEYYSGQTYADLTPDQIAALDATRARATSGSPLVQGAQDLVQRTISGEFVNSNPYLDQLLERYGAKANAVVQGNFNRSGRLGSGANVATGIQAVSDATLPYLFDAYNNERQMQQQAAGMATGLADYDYRDISALSSVGDVLQAQEQQKINEDIARYDYEQNAASNWLDQYLARVNGSAANNLTTTTQKQGGGGAGQLLGTALALGSMFIPGGPLASSAMGLGSAGGMASTGLSTFLRGFSGAQSIMGNGGVINWYNQ